MEIFVYNINFLLICDEETTIYRGDNNIWINWLKVVDNVLIIKIFVSNKIVLTNKYYVFGFN